MKQDELSDLAFALVEGYHTMTMTGSETIQVIIDDFLSRTPESGMMPFTIDGEIPVTAEQLLLAISELHDYFEFTDTKSVTPEQIQASMGRLKSRLAGFRRRTNRDPIVKWGW